MATYNYIDETDNQYFGTDFSANVAGGGLYVIQRTVDMATAVADLRSGQDFIKTETIKLMDIPVNTWVIAVLCRRTLALDADDVNFGDGSVWHIDAVDLTSSITTYPILSSLATTTHGLATLGGKNYTTADTLDMKFDGSCADCDVGTFELTMVCMDVS